MDASIHADVDELAKQRPQPSQQANIRPTNYSRWAFQSAKQPPATRFWPTQAATPVFAGTLADGKNPSILDNQSFQPGAQSPAFTVWPFRVAGSTISPASDGNSERLDRHPGRFGSLPVDRSHDGSTGPQLFKTAVPPFSPQPQTDGFSTTFREKRFGLTSTSPFPDSFPKATFLSSRDRAKKKQNKSHLQKSADGSHATGSPDSRPAKQD